MSDLPARVPRHVAIIMDGNGRWAEARGLPTLAGHRAGVERIRDVLDACRSHGVQTVTLFAFSSENWQRPREEVRGLMALFHRYLRREVKALAQQGVRLRVIGARDRFSRRLAALMDESERLTAHNPDFTLVIAADYGGQWDIVEAARSLVVEAARGELDPSNVNAALLGSRTCLADLPPPDLLVRTGGDHRISNFLLWQIAYTELYFTECFCPDFDTAEFGEALRDYSARERRFGRRPATDNCGVAPC